MTQINPTLIERAAKALYNLKGHVKGPKSKYWQSASKIQTENFLYKANEALTATIGEPVVDLEEFDRVFAAIGNENIVLHKAARAYRALFADGADTSAGEKGK